MEGGSSESEEDDDASHGTSGDLGSSSANEYAEGLGCADRKRCREVTTSGFEFDNHPREEYFEEPASHACTRTAQDHFEGCVVFPVQKKRRRVVSEAAERPLGSVFAELERLESSSGSETAQRGGAAVSRQLAVVARRCERRDAARRRAQGVAVPAGRVGVAGDTCKAESLVAPAAGVSPAARAALLRHCAGALATLRSRAQAGAPRAGDVTETLELLARLEGAEIDAASLQAAGAGLEVNSCAWRRHAVPEIAMRSAALVAKWRATVRLQQQGRRQQSRSHQLQRQEEQHQRSSGGA
mmetsp:Transcript_21307/g.45336  ORF Transcript_21307/g.45336 Transcript_21307/m.45336 type:complete len:298 (+) Transcript_21307:138-1031(+)